MTSPQMTQIAEEDPSQFQEYGDEEAYEAQIAEEAHEDGYEGTATWPESAPNQWNESMGIGIQDTYAWTNPEQDWQWPQWEDGMGYDMQDKNTWEEPYQHPQATALQHSWAPAVEPEVGPLTEAQRMRAGLRPLPAQL